MAFEHALSRLFKRVLYCGLSLFVMGSVVKYVVEQAIFPRHILRITRHRPSLSEVVRTKPEDEQSWKERNAGVVEGVSKQDRFEARVLKVLDGDTLEVFVGDASGSNTLRIRLLGIDTPETRGGTMRAKKQAEQMKVTESVLYDLGHRSKEHLEELIHGDNPAGMVLVELSGPKSARVDRYGRILGMVRPLKESERQSPYDWMRKPRTAEDRAKFGLLNRKMLEDGYAMAYVSSKPSTQGKRPSPLYSQEYCVSLVRKAAAKKAGFWAVVSPPATMGVVMSQ